MGLLSCLSVFSKLRTPMSRGRRGATAVEMALITPMFFLLLVGIVELGLVLTAEQLLENAAFNTSRLAKTGYTASGQTQTQTITQVLDNELSSFGTLIDVSQVTLVATAYNSFSSIGVAGQGAAGDGTAQQIVVYTISYPWKLFTPMVGQLIGTQDNQGNWVVNLQSRIVVRNEPYS